MAPTQMKERETMKKSMIAAAAIIASVVGAGVGTTVMAAGENDESEQQEMQALASAKISIADAVKTAEASAGGKAAEVELDNVEGKAAYDVSVVLADGTEHEVLVDANSGEVIKTVVDDDEGDDDDNDNDND